MPEVGMRSLRTHRLRRVEALVVLDDVQTRLLVAYATKPAMGEVLVLAPQDVPIRHILGGACHLQEGACPLETPVRRLLLPSVDQKSSKNNIILVSAQYCFFSALS